MFQRTLPWYLISVVVVVGACAGTARAQASECEEGRVEVSGGYCCWPGQTFDRSANRCAGPPSCPENYVAQGADCEVDQSSPRAVASSRSAEDTHRDWGLIGAGVGLIGAGYVGAALTSVILGQETVPRGRAATARPVPDWPLGLLPIVHALGAVDSCCGSYGAVLIIAGIAGGAMEVAGLVLVILGVTGDAQAPEAALRLGPVELTLGAPGAEAGLTAALAL